MRRRTTGNNLVVVVVFGCTHMYITYNLANKYNAPNTYIYSWAPVFTTRYLCTNRGGITVVDYCSSYRCSSVDNILKICKGVADGEMILLIFLRESTKHSNYCIFCFLNKIE